MLLQKNKCISLWMVNDVKKLTVSQSGSAPLCSIMESYSSLTLITNYSICPLDL